MARQLIILAFVLISTSVHAQKNFQGEITYKLHANTGEKPDAEIKIAFGVNKLRIRFKEKEEYEQEYLLVLFDSAAIFVANGETKTYTKRPLHTSPPIKQFDKRTFAGYIATPYNQERTGLSSVMGGLMSSSEAVFFLADSLYYSVPGIYSGNPELMAIQKNRIVLGAELTFSTAYNEVSDVNSKTPDLITVEATEIRPMSINEEEFNVPADYVNRIEIVSAPVEDSVAAPAPDTVLVAPHLKKPVKKAPVRSNKPKTAIKPAAIKPKQ